MSAQRIDPKSEAQAQLPVEHMFNWRSTAFSSLGPTFGVEVEPQPIQAPHWVIQNTDLAADLGLDTPQQSAGFLGNDALLAVLAGNAKLSDANYTASVYSGHQFGMWAGQLGDGRALLLGTHESPKGPVEIQLKGAGRTPFSRMGDGRAVLRSSIREYLCSEAMHALGIETTRALSLVASDTPVRRETLERAAVLTRSAPSFIRFGHFEHFFYTNQHAELKQLADFVIAEYMPELALRTESGNPYAQLLQEVAARTAKLMAQWLGVGFVHGVMNTDNMSILGLTLDYGPFQFLDSFEPNRITNHSDAQGRYTLQMQASIAHWNVGKLAVALNPLLDLPEQGVAALQTYRRAFEWHFVDVMTRKLGGGGKLNVSCRDYQLANSTNDMLEEGQKVAAHVLGLLAKEKVDYTIFWRRLSDAAAGNEFSLVKRMFADKAGIEQWIEDYRAWLDRTADAQSISDMRQANPKYILRNYLAENAIARANEGDYEEVHVLVELLKKPFDEHPDQAQKADFPPIWANDIEVSCSS